ncbi:ferredoxin [Saccharopolyspora endophytica]|uniref:Ferredoxin n=1 Tax=Saccharopolyspora endophytica TaxID=543886 RepID=A0ABS5DB59_9PSEU|nr:ferredoxin [Saccharopolyspora endophytica]MBQ0923526.1 ferredoxin [Saccharopolyspora endophytica]
MRISIDFDKCSGHARCVARAPELFDVDDDGNSFVLVDEVDEADVEDAHKAVDVCPERAISVHED